MNEPITLEIAQAHLAQWLAADLAVSQGQEYEIDTGGTRRKLKRVDAKEIENKINFWASQVTRLSAGSRKIRPKLVVNRD